MEIKMITPDLNVRRYLNGSKIDRFEVGQMATLNYPNGYGHGTRVHNESVALTTGQQPCVKVSEVREGNNIMRIRKLVPVECLKLMGFTREDYQAMRDIGMTDAQIYHCAGDALCVNVCAMLLGQVLPISEDKLRYIVEQYIEKEIVEK